MDKNIDKIINVTFPGGKKVDAQIGEFVIKTDQATANGGNGSAPEPFKLFLASIATCAGFYALEFCQSRQIATEGLALAVRYHFDTEKKMYTSFRIEATLPRNFPAKYKDAITRAIDLCAVKRHIVDAPKFELVVTETTQQ